MPETTAKVQSQESFDMSYGQVTSQRPNATLGELTKGFYGIQSSVPPTDRILPAKIYQDSKNLFDPNHKSYDPLKGSIQQYRIDKFNPSLGNRMRTSSLHNAVAAAFSPTLDKYYGDGTGTFYENSFMEDYENNARLQSIVGFLGKSEAVTLYKGGMKFVNESIGEVYEGDGNKWLLGLELPNGDTVSGVVSNKFNTLYEKGYEAFGKFETFRFEPSQVQEARRAIVLYASAHMTQTGQGDYGKAIAVGASQWASGFNERYMFLDVPDADGDMHTTVIPRRAMGPNVTDNLIQGNAKAALKEHGLYVDPFWKAWKADHTGTVKTRLDLGIDHGSTTFYPMMKSDETPGGFLSVDFSNGNVSILTSGQEDYRSVLNLYSRGIDPDSIGPDPNFAYIPKSDPENAADLKVVDPTDKTRRPVRVSSWIQRSAMDTLVKRKGGEYPEIAVDGSFVNEEDLILFRQFQNDAALSLGFPEGYVPVAEQKKGGD